MSERQLLSDDDINAYADGQMPAERAAKVAATLERDPALATRVAAIQRQNTMLREAFDPWLAEPLPRELIAAATARPSRRARSSRA